VTYATPAALAAFPFEFIVGCLTRHQRGDWGSVCEEDWKANDEAAFSGEGRLLSSFSLHGKTLWIITEFSPSITTVMLPEDY
jgi:hypothetical protein